MAKQFTEKPKKIFETKIDLVRNYLEEVKIPSKVVYDDLYTEVINQFDDWRKKEKNVVMKYLREYVRKINVDILNNQKGPKAKDPIIKQNGDYIIEYLKGKMMEFVNNDEYKFFALNRYVWVRLKLLESKPKAKIKKELLEKNGNVCSNKKCKTKTKVSDLDVHRKDNFKEYSISNCVLLCKKCHKLANKRERI